jgi:hypothetical protein
MFEKETRKVGEKSYVGFRHGAKDKNSQNIRHEAMEGNKG